MMVKLCLMASHGYPSAPAIVSHQDQKRVFKDCQPYLPIQGARQELTRSNSLVLKLHQHEEPWRPMNRFCESYRCTEIDSTVRTPTLIDVQDARPDSVLFSFGIAEKCSRQEKILQFLMSESNKLERDGLDLSLLSELMGLQAVMFDAQQLSHSPLIYPSGRLDSPKSLVDFVADMAHSSKLTVLPDGRVLLMGSETEMKNVLSTVSEFYLTKNSTMWKTQSLLIPEFRRFDTSEVDAKIIGSSCKARDTSSTLKSPVKIKPSRKKKNNRKVGRERDLYKRNYFHTCESLLSLMMDKRRGKAAVMLLKKSGPELPELLNQFSVGIAGTGIALLFSVICRVACGRDTVVYIGKHASKLDLKDDEIMAIVNKSFSDIYFRAVTVMAVAVLRLGETVTANAVASDNLIGSSLLPWQRCLNGQTRVQQLLHLSLGAEKTYKSHRTNLLMALEKSSPTLLLGIKEDILQRVQDSSCGTKFDRGNHAIVTIEKTERVKPSKKMKLGRFMSWYVSRHDPARLFLSTI
ncbi:hypothetical protein OIU77_010833 [Salix suchowensis]|uniref:Uncharacterized protein n=1 Tax=Salix suchowensis TaxID=1278906 RepID=A0ABQ9AAU3_9ROSI|nr:hypothetical protein OIU77_010833 [Salix suchowensis]